MPEPDQVRNRAKLCLLQLPVVHYHSGSNCMAQTDNKKARHEITAYGNYVVGLQRLAIEPHTAPKWYERTHAALNGEASTELRRLVSLKTRRRYGAFFTGSKLAEKFIIPHCPPFPEDAVVHDPSVGGGDLLWGGGIALAAREDACEDSTEVGATTHRR